MSSHKKANRSLGAQMSIWRFSLYGGAVFSGVIVRALCPFVAEGPASNAFIDSDLRLISEQLFEERLPSTVQLMNSFYEHHRDSIRWQYRCFDRILLNGLIQPFQQPERVVGFIPAALPGEPARAAGHCRPVSTLAERVVGEAQHTGCGGPAALLPIGPP
jgi:hypothetical protein